jgi:hypothetical protein
VFIFKHHDCKADPNRPCTLQVDKNYSADFGLDRLPSSCSIISPGVRSLDTVHAGIVTHRLDFGHVFSLPFHHQSTSSIMSQSNPTSYQSTRTPSPQPSSNQDGYVPNGRPTSQILSNRQSLGLPKQQQQPNTTGTTSTARFSTGGMFGTSQPGVTSGQSLRNDNNGVSGGTAGNAGQQQGGGGATSYSTDRPLNTANRHVSLAAGMGGGSGSTSSIGGGQPLQPQPQQQGNGNVGDRLATARAVSPRLPGSAGPGSNQFPTSYAGNASGLFQGSSSAAQGLGGLGLGAAPGGRPGAGVRPASEYLGGGNKGQRGKEASPESESQEGYP